MSQSFLKNPAQWFSHSSTDGVLSAVRSQKSVSSTVGTVAVTPEVMQRAVIGTVKQVSVEDVTSGSAQVSDTAIIPSLQSAQVTVFAVVPKLRN